MNVRQFLKAGHTPSLVSAFLYFDISFMVWVLLGALANSIAPELDMDPAQRGMMLALPLLGGSVLRLVLGSMTDHIGARKTGLIGLTLTILPLLLAWLWADSYEKILLVGLMLGVAGASFAAALPLASRWYPPQYQGLAMGIAGAGNSGTALATLFAPMLANRFGWHTVFGLAIIPIALTLLFFFLFAKDSPNRPPAKSLRDYGKVFAVADTWWFCFFYSVTFGGFVGLAVFVNTFFNDRQYADALKDLFGGMDSKVAAGYFATVCVISGSFLRPIGGYLADRFGGIRMLTMLYVGVMASMIALGWFPGDLYVAAALMFLSMGCLGMANGSVFQLVPLRFAKEVGVITGIVGAAGGLGGFFLPLLLGYLKKETESYSYGFYAFGATSLLCAVTLMIVSRSWGFVSQTGKAVTATSEPAFADTRTRRPERVEANA